MTEIYKKLIFLSIIILLVSCSGKKKFCSNNYDHRYKGHYKVGLPYTINNVVYHPKEDENYDQVGVASWYGDAFHCNPTANGQLFNKTELTAAHNTLPLPSVVKVTNLNNKKSVIVVINDRGPFKKKRIIDLSEKAAERIGMKNEGVAKVRVQFLKHETKKLMHKLGLKKKKASRA